MEEENTQPAAETNTPKSKTGIIIAVVALLVVVGGIVFFSRDQKTATSTNTTNSSRSITGAELTAADGKDGRDCWVAVDGKVYDLSDSSKWVNGEHTTSEGQARCGADMSNVIDKSPHGRKMLDQLTIVGNVQS